ncbi:hypothetical protein KAW50_06680 [candidate division WOR-3 bacterium]|nr:hypothetical protein [candidate division WOR-3 bacterium]
MKQSVKIGRDKWGDVVIFRYNPACIQKIKTVEGCRRYIQELLGHKSSKTTEIYTHASKKDLGRTVSPLDRIKEGGKVGQ